MRELKLKIMAKNKKRSGFGWGLILGILIAAGAVYYYTNYVNEKDVKKETRKLEKEGRKLEKKAKEEIENAEQEVKKLFDKKD